jgi:hypothetical protein
VKYECVISAFTYWKGAAQEADTILRWLVFIVQQNEETWSIGNLKLRIILFRLLASIRDSIGAVFAA